MSNDLKAITFIFSIVGSGNITLWVCEEGKKEKRKKKKAPDNPVPLFMVVLCWDLYDFTAVSCVRL